MDLEDKVYGESRELKQVLETRSREVGMVTKWPIGLHVWIHNPMGWECVW